MKPLGFLDNDCTIGWPIDQNIGMQIVIAKPKSRFLKLWLQSYQDYSNYLIESFRYILKIIYFFIKIRNFYVVL